jgi:hypothetical protein
MLDSLPAFQGGGVVRTLRTALYPALLCTVAVGLSAAQDDPGKAKVPKRGDEIVVKGCLQGLILTATETSLAAEQDPAGLLYTPFTFQLKGKKDLLKKLREEHDGRVVEVTGELKSTLQQDARRGVQVGKTRIVVGGGPTAADPMVRQADQALPVLDVKSFDGVNVTCGR